MGLVYAVSLFTIGISGSKSYLVAHLININIFMSVVCLTRNRYIPRDYANWILFATDYHSPHPVCIYTHIYIRQYTAVIW